MRPIPNFAFRFAALQAAILVSLFAFHSLAGAGQLRRVSTIDPGQLAPAGGNGDSCAPILSADGRYVLFASTANNLVLATNGQPMPAVVPAQFNVYLRDRTSGTTTLVSISTNGLTGGNGDSFPLAISTNGQFLLFESLASDLAGIDTNRTTDIFLRDLVAGTTLLVSTTTNGQAGNAASHSGVMTPDGRFVAFVSEATNLVAGDSNKIPDVFVRDMQTLATTLISVGATSTNPTAFPPVSSSVSPEITPDGRFIVFASTATNLVPGLRSVGDIYVHDRLGGTNIWASAGMRPRLQTVTGKTNGLCFNPAISDDGRYVAYQASVPPGGSGIVNSGLILRYDLATDTTALIHTNAMTLVSAPHETRELEMTPDGARITFVANTNGNSGTTTCIQVWDATSGAITLASGNLTNTVSANSLSLHPAFDSIGRFVSFISTGPGLVTNSITTNWHVYVRDTLTSTTVLADEQAGSSAAAATFMTRPTINADGKFVAFEATDGTLASPNNNRVLDVFVRDLVAGTNDLISARHPTLGSTAPNGSSFVSSAAASSDGRFIAFASEADNLVGGDTNGFRDVFVRDLAGTSNLLASVGLGGTAGNNISYEPVISGDGRYLAFTSSATNLVASDTNKASDIFVRDLQNSTTSLASVKSTGTGPGNKASDGPSLSADGQYLFFRSQATDLAPGSFSGAGNFFVRDLQNLTNRALTTGGVVACAVTASGKFTAFAGVIPGVAATNLYVWDSALSAIVFTNTTAGITNIAISTDGNRVAFATTAALWIADRSAQTNWQVANNPRSGPRFSVDGNRMVYARFVSPWMQTYLYDITARSEQLVSHALNFVDVAGGNSDLPDISPDGRFVVYRSTATNIVSGGNGFVRQLILYDRVTGQNSLVSASRFAGSTADDFSMRASFSADGQTLVFQSWASDLTPGDFNRSGDVFAQAIFTAVILPSQAGQGRWLYCPFIPGNNYSVEYKNSLNDPLWQPLVGAFTNIGVKAWIQDSSPANDLRFYRIRAF